MSESLEQPGLSQPTSLAAFDEAAAKLDGIVKTIVQDSSRAVTVSDLKYAQIEVAYQLSRALDIGRQLDENSLDDVSEAVKALHWSLACLAQSEENATAEFEKRFSDSHRSAAKWITTAANWLAKELKRNNKDTATQTLIRDRYDAVTMITMLAISKAVPRLEAIVQKMVNTSMASESDDAKLYSDGLQEQLEHLKSCAFTPSSAVQESLVAYCKESFTNLHSARPRMRDALWDWELQTVIQRPHPWSTLGEWPEKKLLLRNMVKEPVLLQTAIDSGRVRLDGRALDAEEMIQEAEDADRLRVQRFAATINALPQPSFKSTLNRETCLNNLDIAQKYQEAVRKNYGGALATLKQRLSAATDIPVEEMKTREQLEEALTKGRTAKLRSGFESLRNGANDFDDYMRGVYADRTSNGRRLLGTLKLPADDGNAMTILSSFQREIVYYKFALTEGKIVERDPEQEKRLAVALTSYPGVESLLSFKAALQRKREDASGGESVQATSVVESDAASADETSKQFYTVPRDWTMVVESEIRASDSGTQEGSVQAGPEHRLWEKLFTD